MKNKDYVSISEFAKLTGITRQAVYNRIDKDLQPYLQVIDNKKMLNLKALELFKKEEDCKQFDKESDNKFTYILQANLQVLQEQLKAKDEQITELNKTISELNKRLEESQKLLHQQQQLQLAEKQEKILLIDKTEEPAKEEAKKKWWQIFK